MSLLEYVKRNYNNPNKKVLQSLNASDELINYLFTTTWNTNFNVVTQLIDEESKDLKLITQGYNGYVAYFENGKIKTEDEITSFTNYKELRKVYDNHDNYQAFVKFGENEYEMLWETEDDYSSFWLDVHNGNESYTAYISFGEEEIDEEMVWSASVGTDNYNSATYKPLHVLTKIYVKPKKN